MKAILALGTLAFLATTQLALADPPPWAGGGKAHGNGQDLGSSKRNREDWSRDRDARDWVAPHDRFDEGQRARVRRYYEAEARNGRCPPGLAKKGNGCLPPGQARKWQKGQPLPGDLAAAELPAELLRELGPTPEGYRFVRVASDILLIAAGSGMVIDAITDLGR